MAVAAFVGCSESQELDVPKPDSITVAPESKLVSAKGSTVEVVVTSNGEWELEGAAEWAAVSSVSGKDGAVVRFDVSPNKSESDRKCEYIFRQGEASAKFTLSQKNITVVDEIKVSSDSSNFTAAGGKVELEVVSSSDWTLIGGAEWVIPSVREGKSGDKVLFTVAPNSTLEKMETVFEFSAGEAKQSFKIVIEGGVPASLEVLDKTATAAFDAKNVEVKVKSSVNYRELQVELPQDADWITFNVAVEGDEPEVATLVFNLLKNDTEQSRQAEVIIKGGALTATATIVQKSKPMISVEETEKILDAQSHELTFAVESNTEYKIEIPEEAKSWITHKGKEQAGEAFTISEFKDAAGKERKAWVRFVEKFPPQGVEKPLADSVLIIQRTEALISWAIDFDTARTAPKWKNTAPVTNMKEFTVEFLMYINKIKPGWGKISNIFGMERNFIIRMGDSIMPNYYMQIQYSKDGMQKFKIDKVIFEEAKWYHIAVSLKDGAMIVYVDGKEVARQDTGLEYVNFGAPYDSVNERCFWMGYQYPADGDFKGLMSEFRIWNKALTEQDLQTENHFYYVAPDSEGLVSYWKMNEGKGSTVKDHTSNGNDMIGHVSVTDRNHFDGINWKSVSLPFEN